MNKLFYESLSAEEPGESMRAEVLRDPDESMRAEVSRDPDESMRAEVSRDPCESMRVDPSRVDPGEPIRASRVDGPDTVTIMINMHAGIIGMGPDDLLITNPTNTAIATSIGICSIIETGQTIPLLRTARELYSTKRISEANVDYHKIFQKTSVSFDSIMKYRDEIVKQHGDKMKDLTPVYINATLPKDDKHLRSFTYNRIYEIEHDIVASRQGIYIIYTNNDALNTAISTLPKFVNAINEHSSYNGMSQQEFNGLQQQNLNNVKVANHLHAGGMQDGPFIRLLERKDITSIKHYKWITLNHILHFFSHFNINHVNIIDLGCRVLPPTPGLEPCVPYSVQRAHSDKERTDYKSLFAGRKTKRRRIRNKKTKRFIQNHSKNVILT
jgi:hypothetical protein